MTHPAASSFSSSTPGYSPHFDRDDAVASPVRRDWTLAQRFGFRFLLVYVVLYTFPGPINELPGTGFLSDP